MVRSRPRQATVAFARLNFERPFTLQEPLVSIDRGLEESLVPGTMVLRYGRIWRMGQWHRDGRWIVGRIGFEQEGQAELWDDERKDFVERALMLAQTVPFAIDVTNMRVAFQLRRQIVRPGTFRGNFQALLNEVSPYRYWIVRLEGVVQPEWPRWVESVDRLVELRIHMERPNPRYRGEQVQEVFERSKAAAVDLVLRAPEDASLDPDGPDFVRQAIEHAEEYGNYSATGTSLRDDRMEEEKWRSTLEGEVEKKESSSGSGNGRGAPGRAQERPW